MDYHGKGEKYLWLKDPNGGQIMQIIGETDLKKFPEFAFGNTSAPVFGYDATVVSINWQTREITLDLGAGQSRTIKVTSDMVVIILEWDNTYPTAQSVRYTYAYYHRGGLGDLEGKSTNDKGEQIAGDRVGVLLKGDKVVGFLVIQ